MEENICTILLNRTLNRDTDDAPIGTIEGDEYYLDVKNGLKKWEQYIDIAPIIDSDEKNHLYIDSYLYQKIRDDLEFLLVYADLFLLRDSHDKTNVKYYPLHCHHTDEYSTGAWIDTQRFLVLEQLDEANINNNGIDIPVESKWGIQKNDGDKLVVTCTVNGNYLIRYITGNDLYILTYVTEYSLNRYVTSYTFVPFSWFKNIVENNFDEYGLYIYDSAYYGLFWSLRNNSLRPSLNNIISLILKGNSVVPEYTFNIYLSGELPLHWKYSEYLSLFKEGIYNETEEINGNKPIVLLYPLFFNKAVSLTYIAPDESVTDTKYFIHGNNKSFSHDSYELYKHNYYIPYDSLDVKTLSKELPADRFRIIDSYPCDFNRFNIKILPMWDSELDADPIAIELSCILKYRDKTLENSQITYIYHREHRKENVNYGKLVCEKVNNDSMFNIKDKNKLYLLRSEQFFFLNDDLFKISDIETVEVTITPVMIFGPLYNLSKVLTIETSKINTNTIELSVYKYFYNQKEIILTYNIELYLDVNATIYNDTKDLEHCPHCYITKLSDFINNQYLTDKENGIEIDEISKSLLSSVYNTVRIPLNAYIVPTEIYIIEFCVYINHLGTLIKRSLFRTINTTEMFNNAFLDGRMVYSNGYVIEGEEANDFRNLYLDPNDKYVFINMKEGVFELSDNNKYTNGIAYIKTFNPDPLEFDTSITFKTPTFSDKTKPNLIFRCGQFSELPSFPYTFNILDTNYIPTIHLYYDNGLEIEDNITYTWNISYQYEKLENLDNYDTFGNTKIAYQDISLMQYGCVWGGMGINWKSEPNFWNVGAFNLATYGWNDDSNIFTASMYSGEGNGHNLSGLWRIGPGRLPDQWSDSYINVFLQTNCPAEDNSFVPIYILGRQVRQNSGDGRLVNTDYMIDKRPVEIITGYGCNRQNEGIPTGGSDELWRGQYMGLIIWKGQPNLLTGIWFHRERLDGQNIFLRTSDGWQCLHTHSIANIMAAKLSLYYFRKSYKALMKEIYNTSFGIQKIGDVYILTNGSAKGHGTSNIKLNMFSSFKYKDNDYFKLLPTKDKDDIKLYRFINLNDHIQYNVGNTKLLIKDIQQQLIIGLSGSENNKENILNNFFFNNLVHSDVAHNLLKNKVDITDDAQLKDEPFIKKIINDEKSHIIDKNDLETHSLFYEYNKNLNSLQVVSLNTDVTNCQNYDNILCVYPDGHFSVVINTNNKADSKLRYCIYGEHELQLIHNDSAFNGIAELSSINNPSRFAFVNRNEDHVKAWVRPRIISFDENTKSFGILWGSFWVNDYESKGCLIRSIYDLVDNETLYVQLTEVIQNFVHPI